MVEKIFSRIVESIEKNILDEDIEIDEGNFVELEKVENGKVAFVDGGQQEILKAVNFSLQFIRVAGVVYLNNKKVDSKLDEFFVLVKVVNEDEYETEIFSLKGEAIDNININSFDSSIKDGNERADISKVGGMARRFAELRMAKQIMNDADYVVLDGSLKTMVKGEEMYMEDLFEKATETGKIISGLAKTSRMMEEGKNVASKLKKEGEWSYKLEDEEDYAVSIVRLNKSANYVFEFNIFKDQKEKMIEVLGILVGNAKDAVFPGYPFGLIMADKVARVSNQEKDYLLTRFQAAAGKKWKKIMPGLNMLNAHDILDNI